MILDFKSRYRRKDIGITKLPMSRNRMSVENKQRDLEIHIVQNRVIASVIASVIAMGKLISYFNEILKMSFKNRVKLRLTS